MPPDNDISLRLVILAICAVIGCLVTILINWDKIVAGLKRLLAVFFTSQADKEARLLNCFKDYLIHYGYDFDNGKGREFFHLGDLSIDIQPKPIYQWASDNFDTAINGLINAGYLERVESGFSKNNVKLTEAGRHYYTAEVKPRIEQSITHIETTLLTTKK